VLYQLLTGHPPFAGGTTYETIKLVLETEPRQPRLLNPKVDRDLSTICLKCLEKDPHRRYSSALALAEDLEHCLKHEEISARHTGIFTRGRKWVWRNPSAAVLITLLVALAAGLTVIVWNRESPEPGKVLSTAAQIAVALAGFACVVVVLRRDTIYDWTPADRLRLRLLLINSVAPLILCLSGLLLLTMKPVPTGIWQWCSAGSFVIVVLFLTPSLKILRRLDLREAQNARSMVFMVYFSATLGTAVLLLQLYNAIILGAFWPFFTAIAGMLALGMLQF